jgi:protein involved in polysaccharide export with SLBB domain
MPKVGDQLRVKVFRVVSEPQQELPADVTFDGAINVDFVASVALLVQEYENSPHR